MKQTLFKYSRLLFIGFGLSLLLLVAASFMRPAAPTYAALPPRPTAVPVVTVNGAQIKLTVADAVGNEWTAVQWQDPNSGDWITVEGWQGTLETDGSQIWWVGSEQFGKGPFRWLLFDEEGGTLLDTSESFTLPSQNREIITVTIPAAQD